MEQAVNQQLFIPHAKQVPIRIDKLLLMEYLFFYANQRIG